MRVSDSPPRLAERPRRKPHEIGIFSGPSQKIPLFGGPSQKIQRALPIFTGQPSEIIQTDPPKHVNRRSRAVNEIFSESSRALEATRIRDEVSAVARPRARREAAFHVPAPRPSLPSICVATATATRVFGWHWNTDSYLSGICNQLRVEDHFPEVRKNRASRIVSKTLAGCKRMRGTATKRKQLLSVHDLLIVVRWLQDRVLRGVATHDDFLFVSQLLTGFYAQLRLGELTYPDKVALRNPRKLDGPTDPHKPFRDYIASRDKLFPYHPQLWLRANGTVPTRSWFIKRLRTFFPKSIAGQSMRAGGATCLAESGALPHIIQAAGRWASDTFQIYIRKNPILLQGLIHGRPAFEAEPSRTAAHT
ncbi:hypothetical protein B0H13DRAFT_2344426 [Mycena leptocephala]|nr:hypothetical protein B0H13DRAFT_2344426 [Mycena leptocephala]